jgi:hypothetical protein
MRKYKKDRVEVEVREQNVEEDGKWERRENEGNEEINKEKEVGSMKLKRGREENEEKEMKKRKLKKEENEEERTSWGDKEKEENDSRKINRKRMKVKAVIRIVGEEKRSGRCRRRKR